MEEFWPAWFVVRVLFVVIYITALLLYMVYIENRGVSIIKTRQETRLFGFSGLVFIIATFVKIITKEIRIPERADRFYFCFAPIFSFITVVVVFSNIPFISGFSQIVSNKAGVVTILVFLSFLSMGRIIAGWSSENNYAMVSSVKNIFYQLSSSFILTLSFVGIIFVFSSVDVGEIIAAQGAPLFQYKSLILPKWGIFIQPLGFLLILFVFGVEAGRIVPNLRDGDQWIIGYAVEYGSAKNMIFVLVEYVYVMVLGAVLVALYFGGWQILPGLSLAASFFRDYNISAGILQSVFEFLSYSIKLAIALWVLIWIRCNFTKLRYDQFVKICWKYLYPVAIFNIFITAGLIYYGVF